MVDLETENFVSVSMTALSWRCFSMKGASGLATSAARQQTTVERWRQPWDWRIQDIFSGIPDRPGDDRLWRSRHCFLEAPTEGETWTELDGGGSSWGEK